MILREDFEAMIDTDLDTGMVLNRLHRYYCGPMKLKNKCKLPCTNCKANLKNIFERFDNPNSPYGFLVWSIRTEVANIEEAKELVKPNVDLFGDRIEANPFEVILENL